MAHVVLGHTTEADFTDTERTPKNLREVEAESVALLCCEALNLEGANYCRGYIQNLATPLGWQRRCNSRKERTEDLSRRRSNPPRRQTTSKRKRNGTLTAKRARKALSRSPSPSTNLSTVRRKIDATKPYHKQTIHHHRFALGRRSSRQEPKKRSRLPDKLRLSFCAVTCQAIEENCQTRT